MPDTPDTQGFRKILLAYDGSHQGRVALRCVEPLLQSPDTVLHLLAVVPLTGALATTEGFYTEAMYDAERERVQGILDEGVAWLQKRGLHAEGHLRAGQPAHQISELAVELGVDLVVVGHHRRGVLARWWQGSVGASLLDKLECNLLVAQEPEQNAD